MQNDPYNPACSLYLDKVEFNYGVTDFQYPPNFNKYKTVSRFILIIYYCFTTIFIFFINFFLFINVKMIYYCYNFMIYSFLILVLDNQFFIFQGIKLDQISCHTFKRLEILWFSRITS